MDQSGLHRLEGPEYDTDQEWQLRSMRYGERWACDSTHSHYKRAKPTQTDPEDDRDADPSLPMGSTSKTYDPRKASGSGRTVAKSGRIHPHPQDIGGQELGTRGISRVQLATLRRPAQQPMFSEAFTKRKETQGRPLVVTPHV